MMQVMDPTTAVDAIRREIRDTTREGKPARVLVAERSYPAPAADVWDALTNPDRIPRWLGPISGDLRLGGHYKLEGNAGGTIETCEPPRHLGVTWEYEGGISWVDVHLAQSGDDTTLRLEHLTFTDDFADKWDEFGPGAVGIGWDLTLLGLAEHLGAGTDVTPDPTDAAGVEFMRLSSEGWCRASIAYGTPPGHAEEAAARTTGFYTGG
jgi:uncharacterized protein YndB with AHSA1/START domain